MNEPSRPLSARDAYRLAALSDRAELLRVLQSDAAVPAAAIIVKATIAVFDGDTRSAEAIFARAVSSLPRDTSYAYVIDLFASLFIGRLDYRRALSLLEDDPPDAMRAAYAASRAVAYAQAGQKKAARYCHRAAVRLRAGCDDDIVRIRIDLRGALTAFYLGSFEESVKCAEPAVKSALEIGAWSLAAHCLALLVNVAFGVFGDGERAAAYASRELEVAKRAHDASAIALALSYQLEIAAARGDLRAVRSLRSELAEHSMGPRFRERMSVVLAEILTYTWTGNFLAASARSGAMRDGDCSGSEGMLCDALTALALYACDSPRDALASAAKVFAAGAPPTFAERHFACMARIIAAHVELRCGRKFAGQRHLAASSLRDVPETDLAVLVASGSLSEEAAPKWLAGYVRAMRQADTAAARRATVLELTTTEQTVLALLAEGQPAKLVASSLGIRTSTVRTHAAAIAKNLGTHTIVETIAEARRRGIL